jgi:DNA-binding GntR family transcriptional regulator
MAQSGALVQPGPLFLGIAETLAERVASGELAPGAQLLGERELCKQFGVSRVTIRRALAELRDRGLIDSDSARGWFVQAPSVGEPNALMSFSEMARSKGLAATSVVLRAETRHASIDEAEQLGIAPGSELFDLERVRRLDDVAVAIEHSRLPLRIAPDLPRADLARDSLYETLRAAGVFPAYAEYVIQAIGASAEQAVLLDLVEHAPLLMASAVTHDRAGRPIEISRSVFRGDRYRFRTTLFRSGQEPIR